MEGPSFGGYTNDIDVDGFEIFGVGILPVSSRVSLLGTLGAFRWSYDFHSSDPADPNRSLSDSDFSAAFGAGVNVAVTESGSANLQVGWQRFQNVGKRFTVEHSNDYDLILGGFTYHFGK